MAATPTPTGKHIVVVGAGAVGGYLGAHLWQAEHDPVLVDPWPEHVETIRRQGLEVTGMTDAETIVARPRMLHVTELQSLAKGPPVDIAILSVKSYDTVWATHMIAQYLGPDGYVVSAQNCINEERIASVVGWGKTVGCMVGNNFAVDLYEAGRVRRTMPKDPAVYSLETGEVHGRITPRVEELARILSAADAARATTNLWGVRWSKLCVNGMRNGVSAATGLGGNARDGHPVVRKVVVRLAAEAIAVGRALGYDLEPIAKVEPDLYLRAAAGDAAAVGELDAIMDGWTKGTARSNLQRPSMAQDIAKGRRTEIDFMNGYIAEKGAAVGVQAPTHRALAEIVQQVERGAVAPRPDLLFPLAS
jgi:2-dehydropantoate 2-reductase